MASKVAVVTGGAQGVGKTIARVLLKGGCKVGLIGRNEIVGKQTADEFSSQFGSGSCVFYKCDVTQTEALKECIAEVGKRMGSVVIVVNNAGILDESAIDKTIDINLKAVMDLTNIAVEKMRKDKGGNGGTIVNISSMAGMVPWTGFPAYTASKWAVVGYTLSMASSLKLAEEDWGISLLTLCPSYINTALLTTKDKESQASPFVPTGPCQKLYVDGLKAEGAMSLDDVAKAFETLLEDNRSGSVMWLRKHGDNVIASYVQNKWSDVE